MENRVLAPCTEHMLCEAMGMSWQCSELQLSCFEKARSQHQQQVACWLASLQMEL